MWTHEKSHRESPRINANRIFLPLSSCPRRFTPRPRSYAAPDRLRVAGTPAWKMLENPRRGFSPEKIHIWFVITRI